MNVRGFAVAAVFLVGCAVGGVSSQLVVPKASAQQAATLTKWEYHCWTDGHAEEVAGVGNKLGNEGWEMVNYITYSGGTNACFKRPKM